MIKQRRLTLTTTIVELVSEDPQRTSFFVQNLDDDGILGIYARKDNPVGSIWVYPRCWLYFEKHDDADKQWFIKVDTGTANITIVEFFREEKPKEPVSPLYWRG